MNANADALSRNPVIFHQINVITRKQAAMKKGFEEKREKDKGGTECNTRKQPITEILKETRRERSNKKINYAESEDDSNIEAEIKLSEIIPTSENYQTSPTNDVPIPSRINLRNAVTDSSLTDIESSRLETPRQEESTTKTGDQQNQQENLSTENLHQSKTEVASETAYTFNIIETKE